MKNSKSPARLRWEAEYREQRRQAAWEWVEEYLARNPMGLSPRAMSSSEAHALSQAGPKMSETGSEKTP